MIRTFRLHWTGLLVLLTAAAALARADGVFEFGKNKPVRAVITAGDAPPPDSVDAGDMMRNLSGIVAELDAKDISALVQAVVPGSKMLDARGTLFRVGVVHVYGRQSDQRRRVEILVSPDGLVLAQELDDARGKPSPNGRVVKLDPEKYRQLSLDWTRYRGPFGAGEPGLSTGKDSDYSAAGGTGSLLSGSLMPSPFFLDQKLLGERFLGGRRSNIAGAARVLSQEKMHLRLPREYDPRHPIGLLVWISAARPGEPPQVFSSALDQLNVACVGIENVGNDRPVADRYQLALDAIYAVSARVHVDPRRVYVTGISGGGRVSSMLQACFAEYFTGSLPIVGLSCYEKVPMGNSRYAPAGYVRPADKRWALFKSRRMGVVTGGKDFNHPEILSAASLMRKDGASIRVFDYEQLGHQLPSAVQFVEVMKWVDEPYQALVAKERAAATELLDKYVKKNGEAPPKDAAARMELVKVTEAGPWTEAAWRAGTWLRASRPR